MLITNLKSFFTTKIKGAVHIGAHHAEEKQWYTENNIEDVIWIDANPNYYQIIKEKVGEDLVIISGVGSENKKVKFNISNNGQSSSVLEFGTHSGSHPDVVYIDSMEIDVRTMEEIYKENNINPGNFNFLNMDIQGYELEALKGFGNLLENFNYIYTEVNTNEVYKGCPLLSDIDEYLSNFGFERVVTEITGWNWGDALYLKK
jgi:FkbM family methyltransferase